MSDLEVFVGRGRTTDVELAALGAVEEMSADRLLENASEVDDDIGLCLVFNGSLMPYRDSAMVVGAQGSLRV